MSTLDNLVALVPPPPTAVKFDWKATESALGSPLPDDYKQLIDLYGPGQFNEYIRVTAPTERGGIIHSQKVLIDSLMQMRPTIISFGGKWIGNDGSEVPVDLGPEDAPPPVIAWGSGGEGGIGYWHVVGENPNEWPVMFTDFSPVSDYHTGGLVSYIYGLLAGARSEVVHFQESRPDITEPSFVPDRDFSPFTGE
ncbi:hypothetical protein [Nocardia sp. NPDC051570]|uniref:hypothetical protein n=1 Tax=Nocardia sp. NPDC051570 TaxID=3364324 RepID=UPI00378E50B7